MIWLTSSATTFAAQCDACAGERLWPPVVVRGTLCARADVGFVSCWRGHRIRVRRATRVPLEAAASAVITA